MKYVVEKRDLRVTNEGLMEKVYLRLKLDEVDKFCIAFLLVVILAAVFVLGFYVGTVVTTETIETATEEIASVEEPEESFYSALVPLSYTEQAELMSASEEFNVDYYTMLGLIERETNFRNISGDNGKATGYCQVWKVYWGDLMRDIGAEDLSEPKDSFRTACAIVRQLTDRHGSIAGALTAYNRGSYDGTVTEYATSVLENAEKWREI